MLEIIVSYKKLVSSDSWREKSLEVEAFYEEHNLTHKLYGQPQTLAGHHIHKEYARLCDELNAIPKDENYVDCEAMLLEIFSDDGVLTGLCVVDEQFVAVPMSELKYVRQYEPGLTRVEMPEPITAAEVERILEEAKSEVLAEPAEDLPAEDDYSALAAELDAEDETPELSEPVPELETPDPEPAEQEELTGMKALEALYGKNK